MAIGTKFPWTAAGWFDALNLRTNGFDFHIQLMDGKVPYTDPKVKEVFAKWKQLIDAGFFLPNNSNYSWQESVPFLMNGKAAMILIGNFFSQTIPDNMKDKFGFFPFPTINPDIPDAEDAPVDTIHIPAKAKNKAGARKFLEFVAKPETQQMIAAGYQRSSGEPECKTTCRSVPGGGSQAFGKRQSGAVLRSGHQPGNGD